MGRWLRFLPRRWWSPSAWKAWFQYVHWRLETYGVYAPAGRFHWTAFWALVKQTPDYHRWLSQMERGHEAQKEPLKVH